MRAFLALVLSFQFINSPALAQGFGEKNEVTAGHYLAKSLAQVRASKFTHRALFELEKLQKLGAHAYATQMSNWDEKKKLQLMRMLSEFPVTKFPRLVEKRGYWEMVEGKHVVRFSLVNLYQQELFINGQLVSFKNLPMEEWKDKVNSLVTTKKTVWVDVILGQLGIDEAQAALGVIVYAAIMLVVLGFFVWEMVSRDNVVADINAIRNAIDQRTNRCNNPSAPVSAELPEHYRDLVEEIIEEVGVAESSADDCYDTVANTALGTGAEKISPTERAAGVVPTLQRSESDITGAVQALCLSYVGLVDCLETRDRTGQRLPATERREVSEEQLRRVLGL